MIVISTLVGIAFVAFTVEVTASSCTISPGVGVRSRQPVRIVVAQARPDRRVGAFAGSRRRAWSPVPHR